MEARTTSIERNPETDVWAQLQQKESDILLAAELGKALLEKNEELVKQHEKLIEENSIKIEVSHSSFFPIFIDIFLLSISLNLKFSSHNTRISFPSTSWSWILSVKHENAKENEKKDWENVQETFHYWPHLAMLVTTKFCCRL